MTRDAFETISIAPSAKQSRCRNHSPRGFTLIEALAAMLLVAIVLPVVMRGISMATRAGSSAKLQTQAASLAQSKLAELIATRSWKTGDTSGQFSDLYDDTG